MPDFEEIKQYINTKKEFSIPQLQAEFQIGYLTLKQFIEKLIKDEEIEAFGGIYYRKIQTESSDLRTEESSIGESVYERLERERQERNAMEERRVRNLLLRTRRKKCVDRFPKIDSLYRTFEEDFRSTAIEIKNEPYLFNEYAFDGLGVLMPNHSLWEDEKEFAKAVVVRFANLIRSDFKMGRQGAIKKAVLYLQAVRDTSDKKMVQVYERLLYILRKMSDYAYNQKRSQLKCLTE